MATDKIFVSPGVFTSEKDLTFVTRQVGVTPVLFIISLLFKPILILLYLKLLIFPYTSWVFTFNT